MTSKNKNEILKDEEYLDEKFTKGKSKLRGEAMVLMALAREVGRKEIGRRIERKERLKKGSGKSYGY